MTGILDIDKEIARLEKELVRLDPLLKEYRRKISVPGYESKVPENVRIVNAEKLAAYEAEYEATVKAKAAYEEMKSKM